MEAAWRPRVKNQDLTPGYRFMAWLSYLNKVRVLDTGCLP